MNASDLVHDGEWVVVGCDTEGEGEGEPGPAPTKKIVQSRNLSPRYRYQQQHRVSERI